MKANKQKVIAAIKRFNSGERPENYRKPDWWYTADFDGTLYPAKGIWALTIGERPGSFNTSDALAGLADAGFSLIDIRNTADSHKFEKSVIKSLKNSDKRRKARLLNAPKKPAKMMKIISDFTRNPDVVAEVLKRANGKCEFCKAKAPFIRRRDKTPYLEVHHVINLANGGDDTVVNAEALCPNCHREKHYS
ncbi:HNH endonuclease [Robiginitomaculum antarcticum]|uniref:HNH endonuclease n=1 Tax=Robiginitomaculum antarcticum TaxID=437507 RepID=UPI000374475D|nr:HNH endonuclease signature motif containing protein [Robiginitomaculum antarcticum]